MPLCFYCKNHLHFRKEDLIDCQHKLVIGLKQIGLNRVKTCKSIHPNWSVSGGWAGALHFIFLCEEGKTCLSSQRLYPRLDGLVVAWCTCSSSSTCNCTWSPHPFTPPPPPLLIFPPVHYSNRAKGSAATVGIYLYKCSATSFLKAQSTDFRERESCSTNIT